MSLEDFELKHCLFGVALFFAAMFVLSTLVGFVWNMVGALNGSTQEATTVLYSYYATGIGLVGWIIASLTLVLVDELDGENADEISLP